MPSRERFRRALVLVGVDGARAPAVAERLSLAHMAYLASTTRLPAGHGTRAADAGGALSLGPGLELRPRAHGAAVLAAHGIERFFEVVVISDGFGRRKPHPAIFQAALHDLGVPPHPRRYTSATV